MYRGGVERFGLIGDRLAATGNVKIRDRSSKGETGLRDYIRLDQYFTFGPICLVEVPNEIMIQAELQTRGMGPENFNQV